QIDLLIPDDVPEGSTSIRVRLVGGEPSNLVTMWMPPPEVKSPTIHLVTNVPDGGTDLCARGPKSIIRLLVHDLRPPVNPWDLQILVNEILLDAESVEFIPGNAAWLVTVQLRQVPPGNAEMRIFHKSNGSPVYHAELN